MESQFIFEGKKYISASRGAQVCGYTADYIGQLCRKNQIDCRRVGRVWFVTEESLQKHKETASQTPRGRIPIYQKNSDIEAALVPIKIRDSAFTGGGIAVSFKSPYQYTESFVDQDLHKESQKTFAKNVAAGVLMLIATFIAAPSLIDLSQNNNFEMQTIVRGVSDVAVTVENKIAVAVRMPLEVVDSVSYTANIFESLGERTGNIFAFVADFLQRSTNKVRLAFFDEKKGPEVSEDQQKNSRSGVAVLPASDDQSVNDQVKKYVVDSFSDETEVLPDENGNSGVLKPVFKKNSDQEYLYVIVPVKEPVSESGG